VSEEEPKEEKKPKVKAVSKASAKAKANEQQDSDASVSKPALKPKGAAGSSKPVAKGSASKAPPKQKSLKNFFAAPKKAE
jgi:hypothetical protein